MQVGASPMYARTTEKSDQPRCSSFAMVRSVTGAMATTALNRPGSTTAD